MKTVIALAFLVAGVFGTMAPYTGPTGTTPPPVPCPEAMCAGKNDGNYAYNNNGDQKDNYFLQCSNGNPHCQACFPLSLKFKEQCNQCLYNLDESCVTTQIWTPAVTHVCPDLCVTKDPSFCGNIADPVHPDQYVGCWKGVTVGCVRCPGDLLFNEARNMCLYGGTDFTQSV